MTDLIELRRDLTNKRNREPDRAERENLTTLVNNVEGVIKDPGNTALLTQFRTNLRRYEGRRAGRA